MLGTSFNDVFSIVFFFSWQNLQNTECAKKILGSLVTTYFSTFEEQELKVDKIYKNVILCAWKIRLFLHHAFVSSLLCSTFSTKMPPAPPNARLTLKTGTGGKTTTYICTGVNTAKNNSLNGCLRVAFDFCSFFGGIWKLNFRLHVFVFSKKDNHFQWKFHQNAWIMLIILLLLH